MDKEIEKSENFAASIKLPEGHELLIGELSAGTILEVATWQGIGRPDETTNRFLMSADGPGLPKKSLEGSAAPTAIERTNAEVRKEEVSPHNSSLVSSVVSGAPFLGVRDLSQNTSEVTSSNKYKSERRWAKRGRAAFFTAAVIALISVVLNAAGVSVTVPTTGAKTFFGSTTTSLVIYLRSNEVQPGVPAISDKKVNGNREIAYGVTSAFSEDQLQITTTAGQLLVSTDSIVGRAYVAIPLLGWIVKPLFK